MLKQQCPEAARAFIRMTPAARTDVAPFISEVHLRLRLGFARDVTNVVGKTISSNELIEKH
jgi:hypothetical protein